MENSKFKNVCMSYYFDGIIKLEGFDIDNILIDKKLHKDIVIYDVSDKTLIDPKPLHISFNKIDDLLEFMMELDI